MTKYFVWTTSGPQLWWSERPTDGSGKVKPNLFIKKLDSDEENLTLDQLAVKYKDELPTITD